MTPEELSREIAEYFEPEPKFKLSGGWWLSDGRMWTSKTYSEVRADAQPRPITDPEICLRLLKWLIEELGFGEAMVSFRRKLALTVMSTSSNPAGEPLYELAIAEAVVAEIRRRKQ